MQKPLTVYKASAGSGKTFTLAVEYIKQLIANPYGYGSILAVTFTNKATEEMKTRILSQLYGIAEDLPDSRAYADIVMRDLGLGHEQVRRQARLALTLLLHNYNYFRVQTIDTFFQSVMRNLARELDLTPNLRIGLNDTQVEEQAVDELVESLDSSSPILQWIKEYVMENIREDRSWNVIGAIKSFGRNIFKDIYKENRKETEAALEQPGFFKQLYDTLHKVKSNAEDGIKLIGETFLETIRCEGLEVSDFPYGASGPAGYFAKLYNGDLNPKSATGTRVAEAMEDPNKWVKKSNTSDIKELVANLAPELCQQLANGERLRKKLYRQYISADITLKNINQLRLLKAISTRIAQINADNNRFLLSDTQSLLHQLIAGTGDSPFIYEKIGSRLQHIMIDEFQDTSTVQWQNFKVLLDECMSHEEQGSLIVGDVKQSIYRWRSGDWQLLNNIEQQFPQPDRQLHITSLQTNYRSSQSVVKFNNAFFTLAAQLEARNLDNEGNEESSQITKAYADVEQQLPNADRPVGLVDAMLLEDKSPASVCKSVEDIIRELLDKGVKQNQIAILVRANKHIPLIAEWLAMRMPEVTIVSDEAFRLGSSQAVRLIISALRTLVMPDDRLTKATLVKYWQAIGGDNLSDAECFADDQDLDTLLPSDFVKERETLTTLPFADMVDRIYQLFRLDRIAEQSAFICAFYDLVADYLSDNVADISTFLTLWDQDYANKTIQSDVADGIRIVSVHKSKGLEFDNVILAFCDWRLELYNYILWCKPKEAPFNQLPIVPVNYSSRLADSIYEADYAHERLQNMVDNLNLLYVAFTRAGHNLFVVGSLGERNKRSLLLENVLPQLSDELDGALWEEATDEEGEVIGFHFSYGQLHVAEEKEQKHTDNVFLQPSEDHHLQVSTHAVPVEFRQSNKSKAFTQNEEEEDDMTSRSHYIQLGNVLHAIFSRIETLDDLPRVLAELKEEGTLYGVGITPQDVKQAIEQGLKNPEVAELFAPEWNVFNECTILTTNSQGRTTEYRPDRVVSNDKETRVVDFKFGHPRPEHAEQVKGYMQLLQSMNYPNVSGMLWYVKDNRLEKVNLR